MKSINLNKNKIKVLSKDYIILLIWVIITLFFTQTIGIAIHEYGHYAIGKFYGCENLKIHIADFSFKQSISDVSGWNSCKFPLVVNKDGTRVCNYQTDIVSNSGLLLSSIVTIFLIVVLNFFLKIKIKRFYLKRSHLIFVLIFVIVMAFKSASSDLFKVSDCLFNASTTGIVNMINLLPCLIIIIFLIVLFFDIKNPRPQIQNL